jgi:DNA-directed RNA polymerase subunit RPC12/RpoP
MTEYEGIKNEHILVCPHCGSTRFIQYARKYKLIKSGRFNYKDKHVMREYLCFCRHCNQGFNKPTDLQSWLMDRFNEARAKEQAEA